MWKNKEKRKTNSNEDCFSSLNPQSENLQVVSKKNCLKSLCVNFCTVDLLLYQISDLAK